MDQTMYGPTIECVSEIFDSPNKNSQSDNIMSYESKMIQLWNSLKVSKHISIVKPRSSSSKVSKNINTRLISVYSVYI